MKATLIVIIVVVMLLFFWTESTHTPVQEVVQITSVEVPTGKAPVVEISGKEVRKHLLDIYSLENLHIEGASALYRFEDLQLYPIFASQVFIKRHQRLGPYRSLQDAMEKKQIVITELSGDADASGDTTMRNDTSDYEGAQVNKLFIENISSDTIIILGGEVVRGGKQDRMIAQDFMIMPHSGKIDVNVYCVEHGRWTPTEDDAVFFNVVMDVAPSKVRRAASAPAAQEKVWEEVADIHTDLEYQERTGALADVITADEMKSSIKPYKEHLEKCKWPENVVGVIAVMGDEIVGCDIFAQHELFTKYYPSLLASYCSDAYEAEKLKSLPFVKVEAFFQELLRDEKAIDNYIMKKGTQLKNGRYRIHVATF